MSLPRDLLAQAEHLARREPKQPRPASLRRAVSSAYYAVFHFIVAEACSVIAGGRTAPRRAMRDILARSFDHGAMKATSQAFVAPERSNNPWVERWMPVPAPLRAFAGSFIELQHARHAADYDLGFELTRPEALDLVARAESAIADWRHVRGTDHAEAYLLALLVRGRAG